MLLLLKLGFLIIYRKLPWLIMSLIIGGVIKTSTVRMGVEKVLSLIDDILLRSAALELSRYHFSHGNSDSGLSLFTAVSRNLILASRVKALNRTIFHLRFLVIWF